MDSLLYYIRDECERTGAAMVDVRRWYGVDHVRRLGKVDEPWFDIKFIMYMSRTREGWTSGNGYLTLCPEDPTEPEFSVDSPRYVMQGFPPTITYDCGDDLVIWYTSTHALLRYADQQEWALEPLFPGTVYHPSRTVWLAPLPDAYGHIHMQSTRMGCLEADDEDAVRAIANGASVVIIN